MRPHAAVIIAALAALLLASGGCKDEPAPLTHTSLVTAVGDDPGSPAHPVPLLWVHGGTAKALLAAGLEAKLTKGGFRTAQLGKGEAAVGGYRIGDHVNPGDWARAFTKGPRLAKILRWQHPAGAVHRIVLFGSGPRASAIDNDQTLGRYKGWYQALLPAFSAHPKTLFVPLTPPPRSASETNAAAASRARRFATWLRSSYARNQANVVTFDLFSALAIRNGKPKGNTLAPQFVAGGKPSPLAARAVGRLLLPFLHRQARRLGLGRTGATPRKTVARKTKGAGGDWRHAKDPSKAGKAPTPKGKIPQEKLAPTLPARKARSVGEKYYPALPERTFDPQPTGSAPRKASSDR